MNKIIQSIESDPKPPAETELTEGEVDSFLEELSELTKRYGIEICGCGCCGSPWLKNLEPYQLDYQYKVSSDWSATFDNLTFTKKE